MGQQAYLFEAKGIQRWILEGAKLRDIAAGSAIVAWLASHLKNDLLQYVLEQADFTPAISRRAGGAFMLHFTDSEAERFTRFRGLWRLAIMRLAPGLEFVESLGKADGDEAAAKAFLPEARISRGREAGPASLLPVGHGLLQLAPRTGRPAIVSRQPDEIDQSIAAKRAAASLTDQVTQKLCSVAVKWPNRMDDDEEFDGGVVFPLRTDDFVAVFHADISALGSYYESVRALAHGRTDGLSVVLAISGAIERAVLAAAAHACEIALHPAPDKVMPARPVLVGGDDVTMILRGDTALPFAKAFLGELEASSERELAAVARTHGLDQKIIAKRLTAAAGIAYGGAKQPFFRLLSLAEDLCKHAKSEAKARMNGERPASVLSFYRVTESALSADAASYFGRATGRIAREDGEVMLSAQPYRIGDIPAPGLVSLDQLEAIDLALSGEGMARGRLREIRGHLQQEAYEEAAEGWRRWRLMAKKRGGEGALAKFDAALASSAAALENGGAGTFDPSRLQGVFQGSPRRSPVFDALEMRAVSPLSGAGA